MSRSFREYLESQYPVLGLFRDLDEHMHGQERQQAEVGMEEWYRDQAGQDEYRSWLDVLNEQGRTQ
jgi:hypothetical protein